MFLLFSVQDDGLGFVQHVEPGSRIGRTVRLLRPAERARSGRVSGHSVRDAPGRFDQSTHPRNSRDTPLASSTTSPNPSPPLFLASLLYSANINNISLSFSVSKIDKLSVDSAHFYAFIHSDWEKKNSYYFYNLDLSDHL